MGLASFPCRGAYSNSLLLQFVGYVVGNNYSVALLKQENSCGPSINKSVRPYPIKLYLQYHHQVRFRWRASICLSLATLPSAASSRLWTSPLSMTDKSSQGHCWEKSDQVPGAHGFWLIWQKGWVVGEPQQPKANCACDMKSKIHR